MSLQAYYDDFRSAPWAHEDPSLCGCRGSGWALSDVDTWHECPIHYRKGQGHPEDDYPEDEVEPLAALDRVLADSDVLADTEPSPPPSRPVVGLRMGTPVYAPDEDDDIPF